MEASKLTHQKLFGDVGWLHKLRRYQGTTIDLEALHLKEGVSLREMHDFAQKGKLSLEPLLGGLLHRVRGAQKRWDLSLLCWGVRKERSMRLQKASQRDLPQIRSRMLQSFQDVEVGSFEKGMFACKDLSVRWAVVVKFVCFCLCKEHRGFLCLRIDPELAVDGSFSNESGFSWEDRSELE